MPCIRKLNAMASKLNLVPAPLPESSLHFLHQSAHGLTAEQLHWASGYMAGLAQAHVPAVTQEPLAKSATTARTAPTITVLYGSQTGNGRSVAEQLAKEIEAAGARTNVVSMLDYRTKDLKNEQYLALVVSTHGEGEPPDDAEDFYAYLMGSRVPALSGLRYSVLALGDSSYEYFCETGRRMDERLQALGAQALTPRAECDVDFNDDAGLWSQGIVAKIREELEDAVPDSAIVTPLRAVPVSEPVSREHPLSAEVVSVQQITGRGSDKDVRHIEIDFGGKHLSYQPGDALGVLAENPAALVNDIIAALGADPAQRVTRKRPA